MYFGKKIEKHFKISTILEDTMKLKQLCIYIFCVSAVLSNLGTAQIPHTLSYQGVLCDSLGNPKPDALYNITFRFYDVNSGGVALWTETKSLEVKRGLFSTILGDNNNLFPTIKFDKPYWLSIQVEGESELFPRIPLTTVGYSINSQRADTAIFALSVAPQLFVDSARIAGLVPYNSITSEKILDGTIQRIDVVPSFSAPYADTAEYARTVPSLEFIDSARIASTIPDNSMTGSKIINGEIVRSINQLKDNIILNAQGGATITSIGDTITINAGSGSGTPGVQGIQNTNNTLDINDPNGPTVTINVKNGVFLPLSGGQMNGPITNTGNPLITMGKGNFGSGNINTGAQAFVAGGNNRARGDYSVVGGGGGVNVGDSNSVMGAYSVIAGGRTNVSTGVFSTIGGGDGNHATGSWCTIAGGQYGNADYYSFIGGGWGNKATGQFSVVCGGGLNKARGNNSVVIGGGHASSGPPTDSSAALGDWSTVLGGYRNIAGGKYSLVAGRRAKANHAGTFVWADTTEADFVSTAPHQFLIRASGGVGIGTNNPTQLLQVHDTIYSSLGGFKFPDGTIQTTAAAGSGVYLPLAGGTMSGAIVSTGDPSITMGKGNFGSGNINTGTQAFVAGSNNRVRGNYSVIAGGGGQFSSDSNSVIGDRSFIGAGHWNTLLSSLSFIGGGYQNNSSGVGSVIGGGVANVINLYGEYSTIGGGVSNRTNSSFATVGGGGNNYARGYSSVVAGGGGIDGDSNSAVGNFSTISGGTRNVATGDYSTISGGRSNKSSGYTSSVAGGYLNYSEGQYATIGGGLSNRSSGAYATVLGGLNNRAAGRFSYAAGRRAKADHAGTFVWSDSTDADFISTGSNQFLVRASGGVGIGTAVPEAQLHVAKTSLDNSLAKHTIYLTETHNEQSLWHTFDDGKPYYGIGFRRVWQPWPSTNNIAGIYAYGAEGFRGGLVFKTNNVGTANSEPNVNALVIRPDGNVGIGINNPQAKLQISGGDLLFEPDNDVARTISNSYDIVLSKDVDNDNGVAWFRFFTNNKAIEQLRIDDGDEAAILGDGAFTSNGIDFAEAFKVADQSISPGDVVGLAIGDWQYCQKSNTEYSGQLLGVVSEKPGFLGGASFNAEEEVAPSIASARTAANKSGDKETEKKLTQQLAEMVKEKYRAVAMVGRVPCNVVGHVKAGDFLTSSSTPGYAMKMTKAGPSVGIALEDFNSSGPGKVMILVQPSWREPSGISPSSSNNSALQKENNELKSRLETMERAVEELSKKVNTNK